MLMGAWGRRTPQSFKKCEEVGEKSAVLQENFLQHFS